MKLIAEAWALLRTAQRVEDPALRRELIRSHYLLVAAAGWRACRDGRCPKLGELLAVSGGVS